MCFDATLGAEARTVVHKTQCGAALGSELCRVMIITTQACGSSTVQCVCLYIHAFSTAFSNLRQV